MTHLIARELWEIFIMTYCGMALMMLFYIRDAFLLRLKRMKRLCGFIYIMFWIIASYMCFRLTFVAGYGVLRWYGILAFIGGIFLWKALIYDKIDMYVNKSTLWDEEENGDEKKKKTSTD